MKEIKLLNSKKHFTVDDWNYDRIRILDCYIDKGLDRPKSSWVIYTIINRKKTSIARIIKNVNDPKSIVDHIDRNPFNQLESNLRIGTRKENSRNRSKPREATSKYKGVSWAPRQKKWHAQITINGRCQHLGYFDSEEEAAKAYDVAAKAAFGEFAALNFK